MLFIIDTQKELAGIMLKESWMQKGDDKFIIVRFDKLHTKNDDHIRLFSSSICQLRIPLATSKDRIVFFRICKVKPLRGLTEKIILAALRYFFGQNPANSKHDSVQPVVKGTPTPKSEIIII